MSRVNRRAFLGAAAAAGAAVACSPFAPPATPTSAPKPAATPPTAAPAAPAATAAAGAPAAPTTAPAAATKPAVSAPAIRYAEKAMIHRYLTGGYSFVGPEDAAIKQIQEEALRKEYGLNVQINYESASWADIDALMDVRLQTQGTDSLQRSHNRAMRWISTPGLIRDIDAEVKQYGQNLLKAFPKASWEFWMRDDKKYIAIPAPRMAPADIEYVHIRRDWLDKVNRDIPTNVEEFEEVLKLFRDRKLGGSVTVPFMIENPLWLRGSTLMGPWVPEPVQQLQMLSEGRPLLESPQFDEERLTMFQRWYKEGLLNQEWTTWKYEQVYEACAKGMVGALSGGWGLLNGTGVLKTQVMKADPTQDWVQVYPPLARKGVPNTGRIRAGGPMERGLVVTTWAPAPEAIVALADWENKSYENYLTARLGIQGKHWKFTENGGVQDLRKTGQAAEYSGMRSTTWTVEWQLKRSLAPPAAGQEPIDPNITPQVYKNIHTRADATKSGPGEYPVLGGVDRYLPYLFTQSQKFQGDMDTIANEHFTKIVNGQLSVADGRKQFMDKWMAGGGEVQIKEITDQFNKWIAAHPEWKDPKATFAPENWNTTWTYHARPKKP
jgi:putative aldouronate transport system substrate-binding protein